MKKFLLLVALTFLCLFNLCGQEPASWYFPEYKHYFRPFNKCDQEVIRSIQDWQYLKIRVYDSCRKVELSCYRSKDSTLKEKGVYCNTNKAFVKNAVVRDASFDSTWVMQKRYIIFNRTGTWRFYDRKGKIIKTKTYK